jgi:SIR2-like domain
MSRDEHVRRITRALRAEVDKLRMPRQPYRRMLDMMARSTLEEGFHRLLTTNWDYLLQRELEAWIKEKHGGRAPRFLATYGTVYHLNGSVEPGEWQNRSPFVLETDDARARVSSYEANAGFNLILESRLLVIVGMSFECDTDRGLLGALRKHEDDMPIGGAHFVIIDPDDRSLCATSEKLAYCFPGASRIKVKSRLEQWIDAGTPELVVGSSRALRGLMTA